MTRGIGVADPGELRDEMRGIWGKSGCWKLGSDAGYAVFASR